MFKVVCVFLCAVVLTEACIITEPALIKCLINAGTTDKPSLLGGRSLCHSWKMQMKTSRNENKWVCLWDGEEGQEGSQPLNFWGRPVNSRAGGRSSQSLRHRSVSDMQTDRKGLMTGFYRAKVDSHGRSERQQIKAEIIIKKMILDQESNYEPKQMFLEV